MLSLSYDSLALLDAILNATAGILLLAGYIAIRRHHVHVHRACMIGAFTVSVAFFISYCIYHYHVGDVRFGGQGLIRPVYFSILTSHIILAVVIVPLALLTLGRALRGRFALHRQIARWTWPIWMYVSVTGVVVYLMVYWLYPHPAPATTADARSAVNVHVLVRRPRTRGLRTSAPPHPALSPNKGARA